jgi:hypothetical protein
MKKLLWIALAVTVAAGIAVPQFRADVFRPPIERALERGLGRRVEVGGVRMNLLTGPGFTLDDVTIHEDSRAGIEPFAHVWTLEARVNLIRLLSRHLEFSSLRLGEDTSINLVKTDAGPWNFQFLFNGAPTMSRQMPSIRMRGGRVDFKFGDTKSVFYLRDADFDVSPADDGSMELRLGGAPSRTDQAAQSFGRFFVRGKWTRQRLDMRVELERSALDEAARLFDQRGFGLHGVVAFDAQLAGPPSNLEVNGQLQLDDIHRWDLLPTHGGGLRVGFKGMLDLHGERLELATSSSDPNPPLAVQFRAWDLLSRPHWDAAAAVNQVPASTLVEVARHMGAAISEKLAAEGAVSGMARYSDVDGAAGNFELHSASLTLPDAQTLRAENAAVSIEGSTVSLQASTVRVGENESADLEGSFNSGDGLDLKIATRMLRVADLRSFGLAVIPLLERTPQGTWRGWARYRWKPGSTGEWSGEYELQNARVAIEGLADPVRIQSASVVSTGPKLSVTRIRARAGAVAFTGDYRWEPAASRQHKFRIAIAEADLAELRRLWEPALIRGNGFLARTLRLGPAPLPEWLKSRRADGTIAIDELKTGDATIRIDGARLLWDGAKIRFAGLRARDEQAIVAGDLEADLSGRLPHYRFEGKAQEVAYKGGRIDFEGAVEADGDGIELWQSLRGEGHLRGRAIAFAPDADFRSVSGCFELLAGPRWKLSALEVVQGGDTLSGAGATQADGRLVLDLARGGRQFRYSSVISAAAAQP